jgi:hypothetical protein
MNPRAVRWLVVVVALACAASTEAAPRRAKRKPKTSPTIFGPAMVSGIAPGAPPVAADAERRDTITPYRNALDQTVYSTKATRFDVSRPLRELPAAKAPERDFAIKAGADWAAWGTVQKVSNLILNINVYIEDARQKKMEFVKSVDIRGNTDESWQRGLDYMLRHYLLRDSDDNAP